MIQLQIGMDEVLAMEAAGSAQAYEDFKEKFKPKKTTDDCYTPENIYNTIADWVANEYQVDRADFVRPFFLVKATRTENTRTAASWWTIRLFRSWPRSSPGTRSAGSGSFCSVLG